jgi:hypothetical protein
VTRLLDRLARWWLCYRLPKQFRTKKVDGVPFDI